MNFTLVLHWQKGCKKVMNLHLTKQPVKVSKNITFLGEIPMMNDFERRMP